MGISMMGDSFDRNGDRWIQYQEGSGPAVIITDGGLLANQSLRIGTILVHPITGGLVRVDYNQDNGGIIVQATAPARSTPYSATPTTPYPSSTSLPQVNDLYHYNDGVQSYSISILQLGTGGMGIGVLEGLHLPIGTVYKIQDGAGAGEVWRVTGSNSSVQIVTALPVADAQPAGHTDRNDVGISFGIPSWGWIVGVLGIGWLLTRKTS